MPYLTVLNLSNNFLTMIPSLPTPKLLHLNLNHNLVTSTQDYEGHPLIQTLELRNNKITALTIKNMPQLRELFAPENSIQHIQIHASDKINKLHLRKNKITSISNWGEMKLLKYVNLRENIIAKVDNIIHLHKSVQILNLIANPISQELGDNVKKQVWTKIRHLKKINKNQVTDEQMKDFEKEHLQKLAQIQRERIQREEKQRLQREERQKQEREKQEKQKQEREREQKEKQEKEKQEKEKQQKQKQAKQTKQKEVEE